MCLCTRVFILLDCGRASLTKNLEDVRHVVSRVGFTMIGETAKQKKTS